MDSTQVGSISPGLDPGSEVSPVMFPVGLGCFLLCALCSSNCDELHTNAAAALVDKVPGGPGFKLWLLHFMAGVPCMRKSLHFSEPKFPMCKRRMITPASRTASVTEVKRRSPYRVSALT